MGGDALVVCSRPVIFAVAVRYLGDHEGRPYVGIENFSILFSGEAYHINVAMSRIIFIFVYCRRRQCPPADSQNPLMEAKAKRSMPFLKKIFDNNTISCLSKLTKGRSKDTASCYNSSLTKKQHLRQEAFVCEEHSELTKSRGGRDRRKIMIEKFISIKNLGKFTNYGCSGNVAFDKVTLIYAENAMGKTMMSSIFRSLCEDEPNYILERRTLGQSNSPVIEMRFDSSIARFNNDVWTNSLPRLEIFDSNFINENVYAGHVIDHDHKKNLHRFMIGKEGVKLTKKIEKNDREIRILNTDIRILKTLIEDKSHGLINDIDKFVSLRKIDQIEKAILDKEKVIKEIDRSHIIINKPSLSKISIPEFQIEEVKELLLKTLDEIARRSEERTLKHIKQCMDEKGESWIDQGIGYIQGDRCPFCGVNIESNKLISAYKEYFNAEYKKFKQEIKNMIESVEGLFSQQQMIAINKTMESNNTLVEFWNENIQFKSPTTAIEEITNILNNFGACIVNHLKRKADSPLEKIETDNHFQVLLPQYQKVLSNIRTYNNDIKKVNDLIEDKKEVIGKADGSLARSELAMLKANKIRFLPEVDKLCRDYCAKKTKKSTLGDERIATKEELQNFTCDLLGKYEERINYYLKNFGADYKIIDGTERFVGGQPSLGYRLLINNVPVEIDSEDINDPQPCFRNTLSSGDKSTLAFAFFLARLDIDDDLNNKIVVIDDPISSLDCFRQVYTIQQITRLKNDTQQIIILSHDPLFLRNLWDGIDKADVKVL
jgi:wobble nucleotide-excising tRNase